MRQLSLALPENNPKMDRASFVRAASNEVAWRTGTAWLHSEEPALVICGPSGAGKNHLASALVEGCEFSQTTAEAMADGTGTYKTSLVIVDDMPAVDPRAFLTAFETGISSGHRFLLIGEGHPSVWALGLKDLRTRLEAAPRAVLADPDETLLRAVMAKGFRDRQVAVSDTVIEYVAPRIPCTFAAAHGFVALADRTALEENRKITTPFVQKLLDNLSEGD
ncbi:hypothetical protein ABFZ85_03720 [Hyphococcus formosus]|uniref:hypothetical protein n=1 Tax=Hyphococcus formosus TaxID=3143534 RepID=UPI00398AC643